MILVLNFVSVTLSINKNICKIYKIRFKNQSTPQYTLKKEIQFAYALTVIKTRRMERSGSSGHSKRLLESLAQVAGSSRSAIIGIHRLVNFDSLVRALVGVLLAGSLPFA